MSLYGLQDNIRNFEEANIPSYEMGDFENSQGKSDNVFGGYSQRIQKIIQHKNAFADFDYNDPDYAAVSKSFKALADMLGKLKGFPGEKDKKKLIEAGDKFRTVSEKFSQKYVNKMRLIENSIRKLAPDDEEHRNELMQEKEKLERVKAALDHARKLARPFEDMEYLEALLFYQQKDNAGEKKDVVPGTQELKEARARALETVQPIDYEDARTAQMINSDDMVEGFVDVKKQDLNDHLSGYNGSIANGRYTLSERLEIACSDVLALNDRTDSAEMTLVKNEINKLKQLDDNGLTPEEAKAALERLRHVCRSYVFNPGKKHNNRWHAVNSALQNADEALDTMKDIRSADEFSKATDEIMTRLGYEFAEAEALTNGEINRLDSIMIGGKTLRGLLTEEVMSKNPAAADPDYLLTEEETRAIEDPDPEHVAHIVLAAMVEGKKIEFFKMDPANGYCIKNTDGKPEMEIKKLNMLVSMDKMALERVKAKIAENVKLDFAKKVSKEENWAKIDICRNAVKRLNNSLQAEAGFANEYKRQLLDLWTAAQPKEEGVPAKVPDTLAPQLKNTAITIKRGAIPSFTIGYMVTKMNMSIKDIFDPRAKTTEKTEAVSHVLDLFTKDIKDEKKNNERLREIADIAVNGCSKLYGEIGSIMNGIDINSDKQLFSAAARPLFGMMCAAHDMYQDGMGNGNNALRPFWNEIVAKNNNCAVDSPEAKAAQAQINHKAAMMDFINRVAKNEKRLALMGTGCRPDSSSVAYEVLTSEYMRHSIAKLTAQNGDFFGSVNDVQLSEMTQFGVKCSNLVGANEEKFVRDYRSLLPDFAADNTAKFAGMVFEGKIRNDYVMQQDEKGVLVVKKERFKELNRKLGEVHKAKVEKKQLKDGMAELARNVAENVRRIDEAQQKHQEPEVKLPE